MAPTIGEPCNQYRREHEANEKDEKQDVMDRVTHRVWVTVGDLLNAAFNGGFKTPGGLRHVVIDPVRHRKVIAAATKSGVLRAMDQGNRRSRPRSTPGASSSEGAQSRRPRWREMD